MNNINTNLEKAEELFGAPIGRLPELYEKWDGPSCTVFWADANRWNSMQLKLETSFNFKFAGPFLPENVPYKVPCRGYSILVLD